MRKIMIVLLCVGVLVSWQLWQGDIVSAGEKWGQSAGKAFECSPAGMWRVKMDAAPPSDNDVIQTIIPLDPTGKRFAVSTEIIKWNVTLDSPEGPPLFPLAVHISNPHGILVKVSPDTYEGTSYAFATDADGDMVYYLVMSGVSKFVDCDNTVTVLAYEVFHPLGFSLGCGTATTEAERLKLVPPCDVLPPFPGFDE